MNERRVHKQTVRRAFDRAAPSYDAAAEVQRTACERLARFAAGHAPLPSARRVLDGGCGTGYGLRRLAALCPSADVVALDFAPAMLTQTGATADQAPALLCADLEAMPLAAGSLDAIWSSLALQWCEPVPVLREFARSLRSGGVCWIATLGPRTLWELKAAFAGVDDAEHVARFHPARAWQDAAAEAGLACLARDGAEVAAVAPDLRTLLRGIKAIGAQTVPSGRRRAVMGKTAWRRLQDAYEPHRRPDGLLPATYDLILLCLRKP